MMEATEEKDRSEELKPCPFCGSPAQGPEEATYSDVNTDNAWWITCNHSQCLASMEFETKEEAVAAWNKRYPLEDATSDNHPGSFSRMIQKFENVVSEKGGNNE